MHKKDNTCTGHATYAHGLTDTILPLMCYSLSSQTLVLLFSVSKKHDINQRLHCQSYMQKIHMQKIHMQKGCRHGSIQVVLEFEAIVSQRKSSRLLQILHAIVVVRFGCALCV